MLADRLRTCRSLLFLPASNPRAIAKARTLAADMVILDLEDSVRPDDKNGARSAAIEAAAAGFGHRLVAIRVNFPDSQWHSADLEAVRASAVDLVVLPKVQSSAEAASAAKAGKPVVAMIETARGVLSANDIAALSAGLIAGTNDLAADLGLPFDPSRGGLVHSLQTIVLAARASGSVAFDGVYNPLEDAEGLEQECRQGRRFGFDGKSVIHPSQVETVNRLFSPDEEEVATASRLIESFSGGAERFEGRMIEEMHVAQARATLAKARVPT